MEEQDREALENAADIRPRPRLHHIVHPDPEVQQQAAEHLARLLSPEPHETLRAERSTWTINDSRRAAEAARQHGGPLILRSAGDAGRRDTDPLLKETESGGARTIIMTGSRPPASTLAGRGNTIMLTPQKARRTRNANPSRSEIREKLAQDRARQTAATLQALLRQTSQRPYGARVADAILQDTRNTDLPPQIRDGLAIDRIHPTG